MSTSSSPPRWLAHPMDVHCVVFHLATLGAYATAFWLWLHPAITGIDTWWEQTIFVLAAAPLLGWISGIDVGVNFHNHAHRPLFRQRWLNRWAARLWTVVGGWPAAYWQHLHVHVHHVWLLTERDWTLPRRQANGRFESALRYQLLHWPWRTAWHFYQDVRAGRMNRRTARVELGWFLLIWPLPFLLDPWLGLWLWLLPHWCANCITLGRGMYVQHAGCENFPADPNAAHSNNFVSPLFNTTMFHIGYHREHHDHPGVHWSELPALHHRQMAEACQAGSVREVQTPSTSSAAG